MTGDPIAVGMIIFDAAPSVVADVAVDTFERLAKSLHPGNKRQRYDVTLLQPSMETKEQTLKTKDLSQESVGIRALTTSRQTFVARPMECVLASSHLGWPGPNLMTPCYRLSAGGLLTLITR
jgi:hypothetical protein